MNKLKYSFLIFSSFASLCFADSTERSFFFDLGGGEIFWDSKRQLTNTSIGLLGIGYNFTKHWGLETSVGFFSTTFKPTVNFDKKPSGNLFLINGFYHFKAYKHFLEPYLSLGVGVIGVSPNNTDANNEGNINGAIGLNLFFDPVVSIRLELKDLYTIVSAKNDIFLNATLNFFMNIT